MALVGELMTEGGGWIFIAPALLALAGRPGDFRYTGSLELWSTRT